MLRILNRLIKVLGSISLLIIILLAFHYFNSGMYEKYKPLTVLKKIDQVIFPKLFPEEVEGAKAFVSQEILKDIVEAAISSLRLRYNVRYSI